jgi:hypothetical protein
MEQSQLHMEQSQVYNNTRKTFNKYKKEPEMKRASQECHKLKHFFRSFEGEGKILNEK